MQAQRVAAREGSIAKTTARRELMTSAVRWQTVGDSVESWLRFARHELAPLVSIVGERDLERIAAVAWTL
jgi:hypothetical protein